VSDKKRFVHKAVNKSGKKPLFENLTTMCATLDVNPLRERDIDIVTCPACIRLYRGFEQDCHRSPETIDEDFKREYLAEFPAEHKGERND